MALVAVARPDSVAVARPDSVAVARPDSVVLARPDSVALARLTLVGMVGPGHLLTARLGIWSSSDPFRVS